MGLESVRLFVREGARVVIADVNEGPGLAAAQALGDAALFVRCDVAQAADVDALVAKTIEHFGALDIMFNNAGVTGDLAPIDFLDEDFAAFDTVMRVDLLGVLLGCKFAGRAMARQGRGSIINTASTAGFFSGHGLPIYRAAKAGVLSATASAAMALGPLGIRVNALSPGAIETPIFAPEGVDPGRIARMNGEIMDTMLELQPLKRRGQPMDVAQAALFLASDLSVQITGINLPVAAGLGIGDPVDRRIAISAAMARAFQPNS